MSTLEELIAKQRASADAATNAAVLEQNQALQTGLGSLDTENSEIEPMYSKLINETNAAYQGNLDKARTAASDAGVYRSGIRYNQELKLGAQNAQQTSEYGAERTRKLADISRRRSLLQKQTQDNIAAIRTRGNANLEEVVAKLRYDDYVRQEQEKARIREIQAQAAASRASNTPSLDQAIAAYSGLHGAKDQSGNTITREMIGRMVQADTGGDYNAIMAKIYKMRDLPNLVDSNLGIGTQNNNNIVAGAISRIGKNAQASQNTARIRNNLIKWLTTNSGKSVFR